MNAFGVENKPSDQQLLAISSSWYFGWWLMLGDRLLLNDGKDSRKIRKICLLRAAFGKSQSQISPRPARNDLYAWNECESSRSEHINGETNHRTVCTMGFHRVSLSTGKWWDVLWCCHCLRVLQFYFSSEFQEFERQQAEQEADDSRCHMIQVIFNRIELCNCCSCHEPLLLP